MMMKLNFSKCCLLGWLLGVFVLLAGCNKNSSSPVPDPDPTPAPVEEKNRTVLFYMMDDLNLWNMMEWSLNQLEKGWKDDIDGNLLVYFDPSPHLTQFSSPVLLKIVHDETDAIRSEVVKTYPDQDPVDPTVMKGVLEDAIAMYPAKSHGLIIGTHGSAWLPNDIGSMVNDPDIGHDEEDHIQLNAGSSSEIGTKALGGAERYGTALEVETLAQLLPIKYDFLMFHACMMGNVETAYQLRDKCSYMVGCMAPLPGVAFPYDLITEYWFTQPQADLYHVTLTSAQWYDTLPDEEFDNFDVSVIRTDKLEALASATRTIMEKLALDPEDYYAALSVGAQFIDMDFPLCDLNQVIQLGCQGDSELEADYQDFMQALEDAVIQQWSVAREEDPTLLSHENYCGLSCYIPLRDVHFSTLNEYYRTHYGWATASGIDRLIQTDK